MLLDFFKPDPGNPRRSSSPDELRELTVPAQGASCSSGRTFPLLARPEGAIIDGFRRWCAAKLDGKPEKLDVIITDEPLTPAQIKEIQLVTSLHRADLKPYEQFVGCRDWLALNTGATVAELAAKISRDPSMLTRILSLSNCIPDVQAAAAENKLGPSEWYAIAKVPAAEQEAVLAAKLAGASRDEIEQRGRKLRNGQDGGGKVNRLRIPLGRQGRSVTIAGSNLTLTEAIEILQEALKSARKAEGENLDAKTFERVMKDKAKAG